MIRRPPRSTRTDTLFPYTTLFRSIMAAFDRCLPRSIALSRAMLSTGLAPDLILGVKLRPFEAHCRSEEHTSELQSLMRISYAVFCLKKKKKKNKKITQHHMM